MQIINMVARLYDPLLGQFISVDPMADKYPGWGAYVYCYNNPLVYIDPTGEFIAFADAESWALFDDLMYLLNDMESDLYNQMEGLEEGKELDDLNDQLDKVQDALCEIEMMDLDVDNVFVISTGNGSDNGGFGYSGEGNFFDVVINNSSVATLGHEMKHGFQYLEGKLDFIPDGKGGYNPGVLSGYEDEWNANERAKLLGGGYSYDEFQQGYGEMNYGAKALGDRNEKQLGRYKKSATNEKEGSWKYNSNY